MMNALRGSKYSVPLDEKGDDRVYGIFSFQRILGCACTITTVPLPDYSPAAVDLLGNWGAFGHNGGAIHISGLDPFGKRTGPGFIKAIGGYVVVFERTDHPSGLGTNGVEPACIVTWDGDASGRFHRTDDWQHHAMFGGTRSYVTLAGVLRWCGLHDRLGGFGPDDICEWLDARREGYVQYRDRQHVAAIRRLLESFVGVSNNYLPETAILRRKGRWSYHWDVRP